MFKQKADATRLRDYSFLVMYLPAYYCYLREGKNV